MLTHVTKAYKPVLCSVPEESSSQTILDTIGGRARGPGRGGALVFSPPPQAFRSFGAENVTYTSWNCFDKIFHCVICLKYIKWQSRSCCEVLNKIPVSITLLEERSKIVFDLALSVASATSKCTFSAPWRLETHLRRSTMKQDHLNNCLFLHCHKSIECVHCHTVKNKIKNYATDKVKKL